MKKQVYHQGNVDNTLFVKITNNRVVILLVYMDDMIITINDNEEIAKLKSILAIEFDMKDLGNIKYILVK